MSLRASVPRERSNLPIVPGIASLQRPGALLAMTTRIIDTPHLLQYKVFMNIKNKMPWLCIVFTMFACQVFPPPVATATQTPTITPGGPSPTPSPSPTSTPLPTPIPVLRIDAGDKALFLGDFDSAREQYLSAFNDSTDKGLQAAALWGLGRTELADERYPLAIETLTTLTTEDPDSTYAARAYFLIGQAHSNLSQIG